MVNAAEDTWVDAAESEENAAYRANAGGPAALACPLAPMAARSLKRVSWMRSRTVHIRSAIEGAGPIVGDPLSYGSDDHELWAPYTGGP